MAEIKYGLEKITPYKWLIPKKNGMNVPGLIYISEKMLEKVVNEKTVPQITNVAKLPGIIKYSLAMPDVHQGYGAPIGGVAAFDMREGVIVPGFVGFDINCGVRLLRTDLSKKDVEGFLEDLSNALYRNIPAGVGSSGRISLKNKQIDEVIVKGAAWMVNNGFGWESDLKNTEESGSMQGANPDAVGKHAYERGAEQLGTLGSGNHFIEIQEVSDIYDNKTADVFGLFPGQITVMIHTGSRGFGHQVCEDYLVRFAKAASKHGITLPDRQLAAAPVDSYEGKSYFAAMTAAANFAWANRQLITHWVRESFTEVMKTGPEKTGISTVYDIAHNIGKKEEHTVDGKKTMVVIHRKGATRAFPAGHPEIPEQYRLTGQPVLIPGTMGTASYVLTGTEQAMAETWGSTCHGAGRTMSRHQAIKESRNRRIDMELAEKHIIAKAKSRSGLAEEMPEAYKNIDEIIEIVEQNGLSKKIARMRPLAVIKG